MENPYHKEPSIINLNYEKFDIRILDRLFSRGELSRKEYDKYLKSLEDNKDNSETASLKLNEEASKEATPSA